MRVLATLGFALAIVSLPRTEVPGRTPVEVKMPAPESTPTSPTIVLTLVPALREIVVGSALPVTVTIRNQSRKLLLAHGTDSASPFEYSLRRTSDGVVLKYSCARFDHDAWFGNPPPPAKPRMQPLLPGESIEWKEDVARYMISPSPPGEYELSIDYRLGDAVHRANAGIVRVVPPAVGQMVVAANGTGSSLGTLLTHLPSSGAAILYQRESRTNNPAIGVFHARHELSETPAPASLALATDADRMHEYRWYAWLDRSSLRLGQVWGPSQLFTSQPVTIDLTSPRLLSPGWVLGDGAVMFLLIGRNATGARLQIAHLPRRQSPILLEERELAPALPDLLLAGLVREGETGHLHLLWTESRPGGTCFLTRAYDIAAGGPTGPARIVGEVQTAPLAVAMSSLVRPGAPLAVALFAPSSEDGPLTLLELPMAGGGHGRRLELRLPVESGKPDAWAIEPGAWPPRLLAHVGNRLLTSIGGASWTELTGNATGARSVHLARAVRLWAVWDDPEQGIQFQVIPEPITRSPRLP